MDAKAQPRGEERGPLLHQAVTASPQRTSVAGIGVAEQRLLSKYSGAHVRGRAVREVATNATESEGARPAALLLALVVLPSSTRRSHLTRFLESTPVVAAGLASYSVYLWHKPVILFLAKHGLFPHGGSAALVGGLVTVSVATGILSWLTYRYIEKPPLRFKAKSRRQLDTAPDPSRSETAAPVAVTP